MPSKSLRKLRSDISAAYLQKEQVTVEWLISELDLNEPERNRIVEEATQLVEELRRLDNPGVMEVFLSEYGLTTEEGVALMCLAEALLRVPDEITIDALISDKIAPADWSKHLGHSASPLVNASTWGLMLTGKVVHPVAKEDWDVVGQLRKLIKRVGEPVIRTAVSQSMKVLGHQFVLGRNIKEAKTRAKAMEEKGYTYSYDMLGEAARTADDAQKYFMAYSKAISNLSEHCTQKDIRANPGISVKLSALHPRYEFLQRKRVLSELVPRLSSLVFQAKNANMGFNIDAEEADRLDLSLDLIEAVLSNPDLKGWDGFGVVVQAYGQRAAHVLDWLYELARKLDRKIMVRLVKGAYWDTEIKLSQMNGYEGYPVFTRKASTDVSYLACAKKLLSMTDRIYPQFATHNAHTVSAVIQMANGNPDFEFQRLHGMGEGLHDLVLKKHKNRCRIYAPVGVHEDLLAYLVRRLLENGANSSFVNQVLDKAVPAEKVVKDPVSSILNQSTIENTLIPLPGKLYRSERKNSLGINYANPADFAAFDMERKTFLLHRWRAAPVIGGKVVSGKGQDILNPSSRKDIVGTWVSAGEAEVAKAMELACSVEKEWRNTAVDDRAGMLDRVADLYEQHRIELIALLSREAGKSVFDGISEVREAADFCRFYAQEARKELKDQNAEGRGVFACISPWNFPLAIFTGQIVAALVAGNPVIAKPAEQTPLIAARAIDLMHLAGIPGDVLQLLPGDGRIVGAGLVSHPDIKGVCFTGSTETAQLINKAVADNADPEASLIAETGGLNAMIVDSSALPEQAVRDIVASAFQSAGQRCSALRVLYVQEDVADKIIRMLEGAMDELTVGNPWSLATDVGPVIDAEAKTMIDAHCQNLEAKGRLIKKIDIGKSATAGHFSAPAAYRIDTINELEREVFGPILHVATFKADEVSKVVDRINATGYGLTLGVHTRIDTRVQEISDRAHVGNLYVNRNQIGAVVGVQPFGGEGLSGTGPKAGGPLYLHRFVTRKPLLAEVSEQKMSAQQNVPPADMTELTGMVSAARLAQVAWNDTLNRREFLQRASQKSTGKLQTILVEALDRTENYNQSPQNLVGPTGESNRLSFHGRGVILCSGPYFLEHAAIALLTGNSVVLLGMQDKAKEFKAELEKAGMPVDLISLSSIQVSGPLAKDLSFIAAIATNNSDEILRELRQGLASRKGAILPLITDFRQWNQFVMERALCIDTTAAGGNATLLAANEA